MQTLHQCNQNANHDHTHYNKNLTESPRPQRGGIWVEQQITLLYNFQLSSNMDELGCFIFNKSGVLTMKMT